MCIGFVVVGTLGTFRYITENAETFWYRDAVIEGHNTIRIRVSVNFAEAEVRTQRFAKESKKKK